MASIPGRVRKGSSAIVVSPLVSVKPATPSQRTLTSAPALLAWAQSKLPFEHRGRGMGIWTCAFFLGQFSSPLVVGLVRGAERPVQYAFLVLGLLGVAGAVLALVLLLRGLRAAPASLSA